ncbi:glycoside hydrolase family 2 [Aerococcaceae bacterium zg-BR9]|uniref:glycoside hydrolase family 2 protein n=1 Tax=Aerococcaceae bacterium zg-1292 TaxID=2774330 RepID=UPI0040648864|nr:glycoside hydrolase family 2 [Aerococcaceae bacterium zg-BR9]
MRNEYPRPQFKRKNWLNLNGEWEFALDVTQVGLKEKWYKQSDSFAERIEVPYVYQSSHSKLNQLEPSEVVWYRKKVTLQTLTGKTLLHFGAVDFEAIVFVNGARVGEHVGGHTSFTIDISNMVRLGANEIVVYVKDYIDAEWITRGKQYWKPKSESIWYTNTTGIWQTVWIEQLSDTYLERVQIETNLDDETVTFYPKVNQLIEGLIFQAEIFFDDTLIGVVSNQLFHDEHQITVDILNNKIMNTVAHGHGWTWSPEAPNLFDVTFTLKLDNQVLDTVNSYFGMRKIHIENGVIMLNNRPYYQKLVLDQGYWPETLMTAKEDSDFVRDIELAKSMGFNGCRKHQKVEDPRFFYHCDRLGFLVWAECASSAKFNKRAVPLLANEWNEIVTRDYNHPSIITWTPMNESWGISEINYRKEQQHFAQMMYHYVKSLDQTRLVIVNDGWEMLKTDIIGIHNYMHGAKDDAEIHARYREALRTKENLLATTPANRQILVSPTQYNNEPIILTEFGGIAYNPFSQEDEDWGYTSTQSDKDFIDEYRRIIQAVHQSEALQGFCYTQLTDVEQETNGLVTYNRQLKVDVDIIKEINNQVR